MCVDIMGQSQESPPHVSDPCRPVSHAGHDSHNHNRSEHGDDDRDEEDDVKEDSGKVKNFDKYFDKYYGWDISSKTHVYFHDSFDQNTPGPAMMMQ